MTGKKRSFLKTPAHRLIFSLLLGTCQNTALKKLFRNRKEQKEQLGWNVARKSVVLILVYSTECSKCSNVGNGCFRLFSCLKVMKKNFLRIALKLMIEQNVTLHGKVVGLGDARKTVP